MIDSVKGDGGIVNMAAREVVKEERKKRAEDAKRDSLRFYYLGNKYESRIEHFGCKPAYLSEDTLII